MEPGRRPAPAGIAALLVCASNVTGLSRREGALRGAPRGLHFEEGLVAAVRVLVPDSHNRARRMANDLIGNRPWQMRGRSGSS